MDIRKLGEFDMGINIAEIKNQNLKELATLVDNSSDGKTRGNGMIDGCELSVFIDKAKKFGMETECSEILGLTVTTNKNDAKTVKKTEVNLVELKEKIDQKKSEIALITEKIYGRVYLKTEIPKEKSYTEGSLSFLGKVAAAGTVLGAAVSFGHIFSSTAPGLKECAKFGGKTFAVTALFFTALGAYDRFTNNSNAKKARENEEKHPKLTNELKKAQQELKALQKQYDEYV